jgi:c-di-GMP-related signal transduction protein
VDAARGMGGNYFQGYFFCKPSMVEGRSIPSNKLNYVRLLATVNDQDFSFEKFEEILKQEPSLVYKLLRYLNSPLLGLRSEVRGIRHALSLIGAKEFRRWVSVVAIVSMAGDKSPELIRTALTRAYFCEEISAPIGMSLQKSDLFLMALLSVTDAILDLPRNAIVSHLPLSSLVHTALCGGANHLRDVYDALLSYEPADWKALSCLTANIGCPEDRVPELYLPAANRSAAVCV